MKVLSIGNSFARDTMAYLGAIAKEKGVENFKFGCLYIGGCSINRHYNNAINNLADYVYFVETPEEDVTRTENVSIEQALKDGEWDYISIQHGTGDKSRYTSPESYVNLLPLIKYVKDIANKDAKIAFNMAWVPEPDRDHHEMVSYEGNQKLMYENLTALTKELPVQIKELDVVSPTGTTIQNARTCIDKKLTRDGFHLSYDLGRFMAGLTFLKALYNIDLTDIKWYPEGVTEEELEIAKKAVNSACECPFAVTELTAE